jgi:tRNA threonylcarbamoyladenosine biosynthesis protein TsaE
MSAPQTTTTRITTHSEGETTAVGRATAEFLSPGDVLLISGPLGAGKTAFVRGLAEGLGADAGDVSSPTFALVQQYVGDVPLVHVDLYRVTAAEAADLGLEEMALDGILAVEWPDRWHHAPPTAWRISITDDGGDVRTVERRRTYSTR